MHLSLPNQPWKGGRSVVRRGKLLRRLPVCALILALAVFIGCAAPVFALGPSHLNLSKLDTQAFPNISFNLELMNADEQLVADLNLAQLMIYEDHQTLQAKSLELSPRGVQFTVAVNATPALAAQVNGTDQLSAARRNLMDWAGRQKAEFGDFSLAGDTGLQLIRSRDPGQWTSALDAYRPDLAKTQSSLFSLITAIDLAADQSAPDLFKPAILFVTPPLNGSEVNGLGNQAARAARLNVPVSIWLVVNDPNALQNTAVPGLNELQALADQTGGKLALVSAATEFPNLANWLDPLRQIYHVTYQSVIKTSGEHTLSVQVERPDITLSAARELRFELDVLAPNPMFVNPPQQLERRWSEEATGSPAGLLPSSLELRMLVEFPDGYERPLRVSRLLVNNELAAENTHPPFDTFTWDLTPLMESANLSLRIEVEDSIGLKGASIENPVAVVVQPPPEQGLLARITPQGLVAVAAVLLAGAVLTVFLVSETRQSARKAKNNGSRRRNDPVTQPVMIEQEPSAVRRPRRAAAPSPSWPRGMGQPVAPARLVRLAENETPLQGNQVPLNRPELTFGSDPRRAIITLSDPSVCGLHARLLHTRDGGFFIEDQDSLAGTWVNFTPVSPQGRQLDHGDLIHFGRVMYRFELAEAPLPTEPVIRLVEEQI